MSTADNGSTGQDEVAAAGSAAPVSPLDAAAADGPLEWPEDPENDPAGTPVVVLGTDDEDRSTYDPFPGQSL